MDAEDAMYDTGDAEDNEYQAIRYSSKSLILIRFKKNRISDKI